MSYTTAFEDWYETYPRHVGKRKAFASWQTAIREIAKTQKCGRDDAIAWLLGVTLKFAGSDKGRSGEYCPYPATWLNQGRYDDDPEEWNDQKPKRVPLIDTDPDRTWEWTP